MFLGNSPPPLVFTASFYLRLARFRFRRNCWLLREVMRQKRASTWWSDLAWKLEGSLPSDNAQRPARRKATNPPRQNIHGPFPIRGAFQSLTFKRRLQSKIDLPAQQSSASRGGFIFPSSKRDTIHVFRKLFPLQIAYLYLPLIFIDPSIASH